MHLHNRNTVCHFSTRKASGPNFGQEWKNSKIHNTGELYLPVYNANILLVYQISLTLFQNISCYVPRFPFVAIRFKIVLSALCVFSGVQTDLSHSLMRLWEEQ